MKCPPHVLKYQHVQSTSLPAYRERLMRIHPERQEHRAEIYKLHERAFGRPEEARLAEALLAANKELVSLVALQAERVVGHILFTKVRLTERPDLCCAGLGPVAVHPEYQRRGIGSALIESGLARCQEMRLDAVFTLGDPEFYSRFSFASMYVIDCEFDAPEGAFMALEMRSSALVNVRGRAIYEKEFGSAGGAGL